MTNIERQRAYHEIIEHYGIESQLNIVQEELAELIQSISKYKRKKTSNNLISVVEEIADVDIMIQQLVIMLSISPYEINTEIDYKLNRQLQRIKEDK